MAWREVAGARGERSRTYEDTVDPRRRHWSGTLAALHFESMPDSGVFDAAIDCTPVRVNNAQFDGWRITANGWHYALGRDLASHGSQDGWVGFGGRQGAHWFKFRLLRVGYLHWPARAWEDVGGAPTYARANLSSQARSLTIGPNAEAVTVESAATWRNIWTTPGAGEVSVAWRVDGDRLKEEIGVNQAAREWIAANRAPSTPAAETWFGFVFELDWSDVPRVARAGLIQDVAGDFADDGEPVELRDALDRLLAFMPLDEVIVPGGESGVLGRAALRKRFWRDGDGNHYLLLGVRCDTLNSLSAGDFTFDPTLNLQVGASADDAQEEEGTTTVTINGTTPICSSGNGYGYYVGARFQNVTIAPGSTINTATFSLYINVPDYDDPSWRVFCQDGDAAAFAASDGNISGRALTTNYVTWSETGAGTGFQSPGDLATVVDEVIGGGSWASGYDLAVILFDHDASGLLVQPVFYDSVPSNAPKLDIDYTAAAAGNPWYAYAQQ